MAFVSPHAQGTGAQAGTEAEPQVGAGAVEVAGAKAVTRTLEARLTCTTCRCQEHPRPPLLALLR